MVLEELLIVINFKTNFGGATFSSTRKKPVGQTIKVGPTIKQRTDLANNLLVNNFLLKSEKESLLLAKAHVNVHPNITDQLFADCLQAYLDALHKIFQRMNDSQYIMNVSRNRNHQFNQ